MWAWLEHLGVDEDGVLWLAPADEGPSVRLGALEDSPDVLPGLEAELAELLDAWTDSRARDERGEILATFRRNAGIFRPV